MDEVSPADRAVVVGGTVVAVGLQARLPADELARRTTLLASGLVKGERDEAVGDDCGLSRLDPRNLDGVGVRRGGPLQDAQGGQGLFLRCYRAKPICRLGPNVSSIIIESDLDLIACGCLVQPLRSRCPVVCQ